MKNNLIIISLFFLLSCASKEIKNAPNTPIQGDNTLELNEAQHNTLGIVLGSVKELMISSMTKVNGKIEVPPQNLVSVSMPLGGYILSTKLISGMYIKKGEIIATLQDQQYIELQQEYLTTKSSLVYAEAEWNRQEVLNNSKASSDKVFQQATLDYQTKKITLTALAEKLKLININPLSLTEETLTKNVYVYSPITGYVSKVNVNIGAYVKPSDVLFELVNPTDIHLKLQLFEKDLQQVYIGQKLYAYSNNQPEKKHLCEIILISQDILADRTVEVHCHFDKYDKSLLPGMYMNAELVSKSATEYCVPESSVVFFEGKYYIFMEKASKVYEMTEVQLGTRSNGNQALVNGITLLDKQVVSKGAYTLLMALKNIEEE